MRILLVEDNRTLSEWLARALVKDRYTVECAYDGEDADHLLHTQAYDLVILDLALPRLPGGDVLQRLRARKNNVPVLILTANDSVRGRVGGLDDGADDYVVKPFNLEELGARIRALVRRNANQKYPLIRCGSLELDTNTRLFTLAGAALPLTPREHAVLEALVMHLGKTVKKSELANSLYTVDDMVSEDAIEVYVHRLRRKLEASDVGIVTLRGLGYLLQHHGI